MTGQDKRNLRCSQGASPASRSHPLEPGKGLRTPATSGRKCAALLRNCGPIMCLARMLLTSSIWGSTKRSLTWQRRDMQFGHSYFLLAPSAHGMSGNGLLSWELMFPTPLASDTGSRPSVSYVVISPDGAFRRKKSGKSYWNAVSLSEVVYHLEQGADKSFRINPEWVEWLMGFPQGWTEISYGR